MSTRSRTFRPARWAAAVCAVTLPVGLALAGTTPAAAEPAPKITTIDGSLSAHDDWQRGPTVDYVQRGTWLSTTGQLNKIKIDGPERHYFGNFQRFGKGLVADMSFTSEGSFGVDVYAKPGSRPDRLNLPGENTFVYPGKDSGIVWLAEKTPDRLTVGQRLQSDDSPAPQTIDGANGGNAVSGNHLWMQTQDALQRRPLSDLDKVTTLVQWSDPLVGDPDRDNVFLTNTDTGCFDLIKASSLKKRWTTCTWEPRQFAPGGKFVLAVKPNDQTQAAVLDTRTGKPVLKVKNLPEVPTSQALDKDGNLNFVQRGKRHGTADEVAVLTCTVEQQKCYLSTGILQQDERDWTSVLDVVQR